MKISFWVGRSAPPDSTRETTGSRFCNAICLARSIFRSVHGLLVPPLTVGSLATMTHSRPLTRPIPVTMPPQEMPPPYMPWAASCDSSRKGLPVSRSTWMRSRAVSLPAARCRLTVWGDPPSAARATSALSSAASPRMAASLSRNSCERGSRREAMRGMGLSRWPDCRTIIRSYPDG
jgi:hypothetical protein